MVKLEEMRQVVGVDAAAIIFYVHLDRFPSYGTGAQRQHAPGLARLHGVHEQIREASNSRRKFSCG